MYGPWHSTDTGGFGQGDAARCGGRPLGLAYGPDAINGTVHDTAGYAVLGLTCVGLLALVPLLNLKLESFAANEPDHKG